MSKYAVIVLGCEPARVLGNRNHIVDHLRVGDRTEFGGVVVWAGDDYREGLKHLKDRPLPLLSGREA